MNIEQAKTIPLTEIMQRIGAVPVKETQKDIWYKSPFREENTASFHIKPKENFCWDFGEAKGGGPIEFATIYLASKNEDSTIVDALRWLRNMTAIPFTSHIKPIARSKTKPWVLLKSKPLEHLALIRYLEQKRGIPLKLAKQHLVEVHVRHPDSGKEMYALGFKNEDGGYELRNPFFKSCVTPKTISFIRGTVPKPPAINLFEGFMDYLSAVIRCPEIVLANDTICLNSLSCLDRAFPYIIGYGYQTLHSWLDNNKAGQKATHRVAEFVKMQEALRHKPMNSLYQPHEDVNAWHIATPNP